MNGLEQINRELRASIGKVVVIAVDDHNHNLVERMWLAPATDYPLVCEFCGHKSLVYADACANCGKP